MDLQLQPRISAVLFLTSQSTRRLTGGLFEYRDIGLMVLKGLVDPVTAWQVTGARAAGFRRDDTDEERLSKFEAVLSKGTKDLEAVPLFADLLSVPTGNRFLASKLYPIYKKGRSARIRYLGTDTGSRVIRQIVSKIEDVQLFGGMVRTGIRVCSGSYRTGALVRMRG
jgi:hypothetical protein